MLSEAEVVLVLLVLIFCLVVIILALVIWNQDKAIEELEMLYERLLEANENGKDGMGTDSLDNGSDRNDMGSI